jgi:SAM-dependent methyltransferase
VHRLIHFLKQNDYRFVTPTPLTHQRVNARPSNTIAENLQGAFGWNRAFHESLLPPGLFLELREAGLIETDPRGWRSTLRASTIGPDLFLHSSFPTSQPDAVFFGPDTYRFCRLIHAVLGRRSAAVGRALDVGSGSGAGAAAVARARPGAALVCADINPKALEFSRVNLAANGLQAQTVQSDLFAGVSGAFDVIVANPPYLNDASERAYRHGGGPLGSDLSLRIAVEGVPRLAPGGSLILYTGSPIVEGRDLFEADARKALAGLPVRIDYEEIDPDVFGEELELTPYQRVERIAVIALVATRPET